MLNYLIVADDFTGANDTGVQLRRRGIPVSVVFSNKLVTGQDSCVLDTESRAMTAGDAFKKVSAELAAAPFEKFAYVMKKVDSTLRGQIAAETRAIDRHYKSELVIFAPALPDLGRVTINKIHQLNGTPITKTEIAKDPKTPVTEDNIHTLMSAAFDEPVIHIGIDAVKAGKVSFEGGRVFTCDASANSDMQNIIRSALAAKKRVLWVGTAAMADNLLSVNSVIPPALGVIASLSSVTRGQVIYAEKQGVQLVKAAMYDILENRVKPESIAAKALESLKSGKDTILLSAATYSAEEFQKSEDAARRKNMTTEAMSGYTQKIISETADLILKEAEVSGVFLAGGDTAMGFFDIAESFGSSIVTEIAIGIPLMHLRGGKHEGLKIVTKAGAFGREDAVFYALRKLREADNLEKK
ncbi:MAG: four-carbon acid sugar kinase family protein [Treponema sp.]|jgi:uncharacterized protein YgbK (DUF1537 family)|nr:four-carbon acid sugar kinase family protein [Treponema sp.]